MLRFTADGLLLRRDGLLWVTVDGYLCDVEAMLRELHARFPVVHARNGRDDHFVRVVQVRRSAWARFEFCWCKFSSEFNLSINGVGTATPTSDSELIDLQGFVSLMDAMAAKAGEEVFAATVPTANCFAALCEE